MTTLPSSSTHRIQELDGGWVRKDLSATGYLSAERVRPEFAEDPTREPAAYREVLGPLGIGPRCRGSGRDWVVLEKVDVPVLWEIGDPALWAAVTGWVARLHKVLARADTARVPLLVYDADLFAAWRTRASRAGTPARVIKAHERATEVLLSLPPMVLHGDLYPSNLLVSREPPLSVWPIDWELISSGPVVLDLAALTAGRWRPERRDALVGAYRESAEPAELGEEWDRALEAARLQICVQWLGMPRSWSPPPWEANDWAGEADRLARRF